jgi:integral membrane protein
VFRAPLNLFRTLAIAEAISWTLLLGGLILRATAGLDVAVSVGGAIHGFVFLAYGATAVLVALNQRWSVAPAIIAIGSAVIPYATIPTEIWLQRSGRLAGVWRRHETDDPRDRRPVDRLLRFFLRRPWVLGLLLVAGVALIFVVLLVVGPPGGRD